MVTSLFILVDWHAEDSQSLERIRHTSDQHRNCSRCQQLVAQEGAGWGPQREVDFDLLTFSLPHRRTTIAVFRHFDSSVQLLLCSLQVGDAGEWKQNHSGEIWGGGPRMVWSFSDSHPPGPGGGNQHAKGSVSCHHRGQGKACCWAAKRKPAIPKLKTTKSFRLFLKPMLFFHTNCNILSCHQICQQITLCILCDQELRIRDDSYVKELKGQEEEQALLIDRMEDQIKTMTKAYREELAQLEVRLHLQCCVANLYVLKLNR